MKIVLKIIAIIVVIFIAYIAYGTWWTYRFYSRADKLRENLPDTFKINTPLQQDTMGYFCITGIINGVSTRFFLDTNATSMCKVEQLKELGASYWSTFPRPVHNYYGQSQFLRLYELAEVDIYGKVLYKPLFKGIPKSNALYRLLRYPLLGKDILQNFTWKFSLDDKVLTLFSVTDSAMLANESKGFIKIEDGLSGRIPLSFPNINEGKGYFLLDTGSPKGVGINKNLFETLKKKYAYDIKTRHNRATDTTYLFKDVAINLIGINISDCEVYYRPLENTNLIGTDFLKNFNFILGYHMKNDSSLLQKDLYIQPRKTKVAKL